MKNNVRNQRKMKRRMLFIERVPVNGTFSLAQPSYRLWIILAPNNRNNSKSQHLKSNVCMQFGFDVK